MRSSWYFYDSDASLPDATHNTHKWMMLGPRSLGVLTVAALYIPIICLIGISLIFLGIGIWLRKKKGAN